MIYLIFREKRRKKYEKLKKFCFLFNILIFVYDAKLRFAPFFGFFKQFKTVKNEIS